MNSQSKRMLDSVDSPWPSEVNLPILFILDAANRVEERLLTEWVQSTASRNSNYDTVVIPICLDPENIPTKKLEAALQSSENRLICPLRVVWNTSVDAIKAKPRLRDLLLGNTKRPSALKASRILKVQPNKAVRISATPASIDELNEKYKSRGNDAEASDSLADFIASQASLALDAVERKLTGSRYKVPRQVARNLQARSKFKQALKNIGAQTGQPKAELLKETQKIMKELISIPSTFWIDFMGFFNRYMINLGYETEMVIDHEKLAEIRQVTQENPSVLLWTHKTHVDGFALHTMLLENDFPAPHILGGVNMAFGGFGFAARRAGAVFIRRSFQDNPLYKMIMQHYIAYLLEKRFPLTWAFEGTRSRVGKLMPPRYGILKYVLSAAHSDNAENLHIIPVALNYDLIGDVNDYASEQAGKTKQPESLRWFIGYLRGLKQPMGRIYVDIGEPVKLPTVPNPDDLLVVQKIAFQVGVEVNNVTPVTLTALASMILLSNDPRALTREEIRREMAKYLQWAKERGVPVTSSAQLENEHQVFLVAQAMVENGLVTRYDGGPEEVFVISPENHGIANYYRNTSIHHFVHKAIAELSLVYVSNLSECSVEAFWQEAERLRDLFKFEFFYAPIDEFRDQIRDELNRFDSGWEDTLKNTSNANKSSAQAYAKTLLESMTPLVSHATLLTFIEAYRVVSDVLARKQPSEEIEEKAFIDECMAYGKQALLQRQITSPASIGKLLFQNGYNLMDNLELLTEKEQVESKRLQMSQYFRELARRIEIVRAISFPR